MTFMTHIRPSVLSVLLAFLALVGPAVVTEAETRFVANNGVDSNNTCVAHPCRSIGHAIQNATSGDTIVVGPGRYSWESEPGPGFCSCVIQVDKPLTIESRDGARVTVLDATGHPVNVVQIEANDVVFGELQKGFTLTGAVLSSAAAGSGLVILAGLVPGVPTAPDFLQATGSPLTGRVSFQPPTDDGGLPITSYTVTSIPGGKTATGTSSPITVTGLTQQTPYTFTVRATNAIGNTAAMTAGLVGWFTCSLFASVAFSWTFYYLLALIVAARELARVRLAAARKVERGEVAGVSVPPRGFSPQTVTGVA